IVVGVRGAAKFVTESLRYDRGDVGWLAAWPRAIFNGRFPTHQGHFDPGQRLANLAMLVAFVAVTASGIAMAMLHGGPAFVWLVPLHQWSTYLLIPLLAGHIAIACGILPGYRGVWRSMHLGGRLDVAVARRLWPGWLDRHEQDEV
ncbi:MAG TPA: cytochrome b/b6 domain-containing protein, partial [Dermatophilaceae bacterium]|nr:cytochrome b/b6 domain-containing protein [Dermatophilaceae bacterium]